MHISQISPGYSTCSKSLSLHEMCCPWDAAEVTADVPCVSPNRHWALNPSLAVAQVSSACTLFASLCNSESWRLQSN